MTDGQATLSVIDSQFYLHTLLADTPSLRTYRATHGSGIEMVVKIVYRSDHFFDRLARLYALDDSPYFSHCICNYPPLSQSGVDPLTGYQEPLPEGVEREQVGVLVLEWVDGIPFEQLLVSADPMERVDALMELALALKDLERAGMCHGKLALDHLLVEQESRELKIIGLALDPPQWVEGEEHRPPLGLAEDLGWVASCLLQRLDSAGKAVRRFQRRCQHLSTDVTAQELYDLLKQVRRRQMPRRNLEIIAGFFRPLHLAGWAMFIWCSSLLINHLLGDGDLPIQKRRVELLQQETASDAELVIALRHLYESAEDPAFRELLAKDIAQRTRGDVIRFDERDAATPIAVLALKHKPAIIGRERLVRIGDWLQLGNTYGYVAAIEFNRVKLIFEDAYSYHLFERPRSFFGLIYGSEIVVVWENEKNLDRLLGAVAELFELDYVHAAVQAQGELPELAGQVSGIFEARGGFDTFLEELGEAISVRVEGNKLIYHARPDTVPVYLKFYFFTMADRPIERFAAYLETIVGMPVRVSDQLSNKKLTLDAYNATWQELIQQAGLSYTLSKENQLLVMTLEPRLDTFVSHETGAIK